MEKSNVKVYFSATADDFSVEDFTNKLGVKPTRTFNKDTNVTGTHYRLYTRWIFGTEYKESINIDKQLNCVLSQLVGKEGELNRLKKKYDLDYRFVIVIQIENNETPAIYLDSRFIRFANLIGAEVEFDQYIFS